MFPVRLVVEEQSLSSVFCRQATRSANSGVEWTAYTGPEAVVRAATLSPQSLVISGKKIRFVLGDDLATYDLGEQ